MTNSKYLETVLRDQTLSNDSEELKSLRKDRINVEKLLKRKFDDCSLTIRYAGSKAKGTMIKANYDLDITCYFDHEEYAAGANLQEIYGNVEEALKDQYHAEPKTSAIRLRDPDDLADFHIDVVPGRFVGEEKSDVFIYQASAEKNRLKTNLDVHVEHIRDSGVVDTIRLMKLWRERNNMKVKTFILELLIVDLLRNIKSASLEKQLVNVWTQFRDNPDGLSVEDPANPTGNDLSYYVDEVRPTLSLGAMTALRHVEDGNWQAIFGTIDDERSADRIASLRQIAATVSAPKKPWYSAR